MKSKEKKGSSSRKNKEAITANNGVIFAYSKCTCTCACTPIYPDPHFAASSESCSRGFYSFKLESRYVHGKPAEHKGFTSQESEMQFLTEAFFNTQMFPGRGRWGPPSAPPVQLEIWAMLCFGPEMPYLVVWLVLWRDWNPFLGQCRILELFRLEKTSKFIKSKC